MPKTRKAASRPSSPNGKVAADLPPPAPRGAPPRGPGPAIEPLAALEPKDGMLLVAFPTTGSAANIAAHFLVEQLELPLVGHVRLPEFANVAAIQDGQVTAAVRLFGGEVACRLDRKCPRLYILTADIPLPPESLGGLARAVLAFAREGGAQMVLCLEAVVRNEGDDTPDVYCCAPGPKAIAPLRKAGVPVLPRALVAGLPARIMLEGAAAGAPTGALVVEALRTQPDGRAAAALIEALGHVLPDVRMDHKPLLSEALRIEEEIRKAQEPAQVPPVHHSLI